MSWADVKLVARPVGANDDNSNKGGLVIELQPGPTGRAEEVGRVAFDRSEGAEPDKAFSDKLDEVVVIAQKSITTIKELFAKAGEIQ